MPNQGPTISERIKNEIIEKVKKADFAICFVGNIENCPTANQCYLEGQAITGGDKDYLHAFLCKALGDDEGLLKLVTSAAEQVMQRKLEASDQPLLFNFDPKNIPQA